jgi:hypothetical protein
MNALLKISSLVLFLILFIILTGFLYINVLLAQVIVLVAVLAASLCRFGFPKTLAESRLLFPFVILMLVVYGLLGLSGFNFTTPGGGNNALTAALIYGLIRCMLFTSTVFFFQFILSFILVADILTLPFNIQVKKVFILGRTLFSLALNQLGELELHLRLLPEYQKNKLSLKQWFYLKLQLSLAIITLLIRESRLKGELIDNRIRHCFNTTEFKQR